MENKRYYLLTFYPLQHSLKPAGLSEGSTEGGTNGSKNNCSHSAKATSLPAEKTWV